MKLWYQQPASRWVEALPIGNGRLGAMVYGASPIEYIQLNEDSLWTGRPYNPVNPKAKEAYPRVRQLLADGKYTEATALADECCMGDPLNLQAYQTLGNLICERIGMTQFTDYNRELDINSAICSTRFTSDDVSYTQEAFASFPAQLIVVRFSSDTPGKLNLRIRTDCPLMEESHARNGRWEVSGGWHGGNPQTLQADLPGDGIRFVMAVQPIVTSGRSTIYDDRIEIHDADSAILLIAAGTSFINAEDISGDPYRNIDGYLAEALTKSYEALRDEHIADYQKLYQRVTLELPQSPNELLPTDTRLMRHQQGDADCSLAALLFQYGRYLLIACSRPGSLAANLQGIWNESVNPPWGGKWTTNINLQMNYWPAEVGNLSECHLPLLQLINDMVSSGGRTAHEHCGCRGWVMHHATDIWNATTPADGAAWALWPTGGAWLSTHLWQHYLYTGDKQFLSWALPVMEGAARFLLDYMTVNSSGYLVVSPSCSPENWFITPEGERAGLCEMPTMDIGICHDLFHACIEARSIIGNEEPSFVEELKSALEKMPPYQIGKHGQLQEWLQDFDESEPHHRHMSHLYALYPGMEFTPEHTPELMEACRTTMERRGDVATGWSMGWKICLWARLHDGNRAEKLIRTQLQLCDENSRITVTGGTYPNLFDAHPPFQIDGNFGAAAGIAEMLLQSHGRYIRILPALPDSWHTGQVTGLVARGAITVDITWASGRLQQLKLTAKHAQSAELVLPKGTRYQRPDGVIDDRNIMHIELNQGENMLQFVSCTDN